MIQSLRRHRGLVWQMARRDVVGRYRGSILGLAWSLFNPLLLLAVYTFVFSSVFRARWDARMPEGSSGFALVLFSGLLIHSLFAECVTRAPSAIVAQPNFVKKVVFPLEILPCVLLCSALFQLAASLAVLFAGLLAGPLKIPATAVLFPLVLLPFATLTLGLTWLLAATGVFLRDLGQIVGLASTVLLFLSPVFYPIASVPEAYQPLLQLNPLTFVIEQSRSVLIWGRSPDWTGLGIYWLAALAVAWLGFWWFQKTRAGFADVL